MVPEFLSSPLSSSNSSQTWVFVSAIARAACTADTCQIPQGSHRPARFDGIPSSDCQQPLFLAATTGFVVFHPEPTPETLRAQIWNRFVCLSYWANLKKKKKGGKRMLFGSKLKKNPFNLLLVFPNTNLFFYFLAEVKESTAKHHLLFFNCYCPLNKNSKS